ncbi:MAG: carboxylating nicotinate-nucleotide diphosphorylase [Candidatus Thermoplasmatota archaeon]|nr:carboxylating nicotinate-nucleotide diphosphorylase [Candidatus Thermoplasmatota archaeon]MBU1942002.1 carboxylating nicotinate-nucleotide diphosphorylase [Candidatus Thermoplasmatota archaeon]
MDELTRYLKEDLGDIGDITSDTLFTNESVQAKIIAKQSCIIAGIEEATYLFTNAGCSIHNCVKDGTQVKPNQQILIIAGSARNILLIERLALNILGRMSGIATKTRELVTICKKINPNIQIMATRKTTPGFRTYEKKAVVIGGGAPHRFGLYDAILIKDNHLHLIGSVTTAIEKVRNTLPNHAIEIEVETVKDALTAAKHHVDIIMLDNFTASAAQKVAKKIRSISPKTIIECSGGITKNNIKNYVVFTDRISLGMLTHSIKSKDFTLDFF